MVEGALRFLSPLSRTGVSVPSGGLVAPLTTAVVVLRASQFRGVDGDDWVNEGTAGSVLDAAPTTAEPFVDPDPGFGTSPAFFDPDDGLPAQRFFTAVTNENDPTPSARSLLATPHTAAMNFADGFFVCWQAKSVAEAFSHGADQAVRVGKLTDDDQGLIFNCAQTETGQLRMAWGGVGGPVDLGTAGVADVYDLGAFALAVILGVSDSTVNAYVQDDADPDVTVGGRGWRQIDTDTLPGAPTPDTSTNDLQVGIGKGWYGWAEVYEWDGTTATPVALCDPTDADAWEGPTDTFTTSGTVWTLGAESAIVDAAKPGFMGGTAGTQFTVPSSALLTPGTGDFTVVAHIAVTEATAEAFITLLSRYTGTLGVDANGYGIIDGTAVAPGGLGAFASPTLAAGTAAWTPGKHLVALRREADDLELFLDGVVHLTLDVTGRDLSADAVLGLLQNSVHAGFHYDYWGRALTDNEITVQLPVALGV